ncbi:ABC transporter ATP-binding protein [Streptacidiphilus anmyonensis]|uniref:ABC transporter ATP-binding protein n=1 Tax=Streptacidiphilus anmyonensis TaxID=405782 RepID=UPI000A01AC9A|nr:ABC transporter ATP-binding protein [Streptacidiphilus anmyonensis]
MLETRALRLSYDRPRSAAATAEPVVADLDIALPRDAVTAIVGPNGCGKSTLLRGLARLLKPAAGSVLLDGADLHRLPSREVARRLGLLPQQPVAPEGITVEGLVRLGRHPHQGLFGAWSAADQDAVERALDRTGTSALRDRLVDRLSGGQRQRAWIALTLAQETELLLLDEPTTFLDLRHQLDVLDLAVRLQRESGRTVVMVLHDLGQAARYADHLVVLRAGRLVAAGPPHEVLDAELVAEVFDVECRVVPDPETGTPLVVPSARHGSACGLAGPARLGVPAALHGGPHAVTPSPSGAP